MQNKLFAKIKSAAYWRYHKIRNFWPVWFYILNHKGRGVWKNGGFVLDDLQRRIAGELKKDGIAFTSLDELFPASDYFNKMKKYYSEHLSQAEHRGIKDFWIYVFGGEGDDPVLDLKNPFVEFMLDEKILLIAGGYMDMAVKLNSLNLMVTKLMPQGKKASFSQRWHRDPEDKKMLKAFVYLSDVDEPGAGPFMYIKGSQLGGKFRNLAPQIPPVGNYPKEGEVERATSQDDIKVCLGKAGTIIFCDTSGLHKGGYSVSKPRIMSMNAYTSRACAQPIKYKIPFAGFPTTLSPLQKYSLE